MLPRSGAKRSPAGAGLLNVLRAARRVAGRTAARLARLRAGARVRLRGLRRACGTESVEAVSVLPATPTASVVAHLENPPNGRFQGDAVTCHLLHGYPSCESSITTSAAGRMSWIRATVSPA